MDHVQPVNKEVYEKIEGVSVTIRERKPTFYGRKKGTANDKPEQILNHQEKWKSHLIAFRQ